MLKIDTSYPRDFLIAIKIVIFFDNATQSDQ